jgi:hypothetical protein
MSTALMTGRIATPSPRFQATGFRFKAKIAGALCLLGVLAAAFAQVFVRGKLSVTGVIVAPLGMIAVTLLFCDDFSAVNRRLVLLAASFNLVGLVVEALRLQSHGVNIAIVFNGFYCMLIGCLVFKSAFVPRILGALMVLGGLGWLTFLFPSFANYLSPYNLAFGLLGQGSVCVWLLFIGVEVQPGKQQASAAGDESCHL